MPRPLVSRLGPGVLALAVAAVAVATLTPAGNAPTHDFACLFCGETALADILINVILYVPVGVGLMLCRTPPRRAVLYGALLSAAIEFVQIVLPGRDASIGDVLANTAGSAVGVGLVMTAAVWLRPHRRTAPILLGGWCAVVVAVLWGTGWLLGPSFPETRYASLWSPDLAHLEWYRGAVISATVQGVATPYERVHDSAELRDRLLALDDVRVVATAAPRPPGLAPIFAVYDENGEEIVLLGPDRDALVFRYRTRADRFRLDQPDIRRPWSEDSARTAGDTVRLSVTRTPDRHRWCLGIDDERRCGPGFTVGDGWAILFYAGSFPVWLNTGLRLVWLAAIAAPLGLWLRGAADGIAAGLILLVGMAGAPTLTVLGPTPPGQWLSTGAGLIAGVAMARLFSSAASAPRQP